MPLVVSSFFVPGSSASPSPCSPSPVEGDVNLDSSSITFLFLCSFQTCGVKSLLLFVFPLSFLLLSMGSAGFLNPLTPGPRPELTAVGFSIPGAASSCPKGEQATPAIPNHHLSSLLSTGKSKKEDSAKEEKRKRDVPAQLLKSAKPTPGSKSQQPPQGQQPSAPQAQQGSFSGHKEIKLTLLNKVGLPGGWDLGFSAPGGLRSGGGWIPAGVGLILAGRGWFPAKEELQARSCWAELSQEGLGLAWRAAHRTSLAAHTLWWLHFGTVLAAPLGHIPAAASRLFPSCSKVPRVPGPFPLGDALGATGQQAGDSQAHRAQGEKGTSASAPRSAHLALPLPSDPVC